MYNKKLLNTALRQLNKAKAPVSKKDTMYNQHRSDLPIAEEGGAKGSEEKEFVNAQEHGVDTPIYVDVEVKPSKIHGDGLFAKQPIQKGTVIGVSHIRKEFERGGETYQAPFPSKILGLYNHEGENPNIYEVDNGDHIIVVALKDIGPGEEIVSDYTKNNIGDLETPDDFKDEPIKANKGCVVKTVPKIPKKPYSTEYLKNLLKFTDVSNQYQNDVLNKLLPKVLSAGNVARQQLDPVSNAVNTGIIDLGDGNFQVDTRKLNLDEIEFLPELINSTVEQGQKTGSLLRKFINEYALEPYAVEGGFNKELYKMSEENEGTITLPFNEFYHGFKQNGDFNLENLELDRSKISLEKLKTSTTTGEQSKWATIRPDLDAKHQFGLFGTWNLKSARDPAFKYTPSWTEEGAMSMLNSLSNTPEVPIKNRKSYIKNIQLDDGVKLLDVGYKDKDYNLKATEIFRDILDIGKDNIGLPTFSAGISGKLNLTPKAAKKLKEKYGYDGLIYPSFGELVITNKDVIKGVKDRDFKMYDYNHPLDYYTATLQDQNSALQKTLNQKGGADYLIDRNDYYHPVLGRGSYDWGWITPQMRLMHGNLPGSPSHSDQSVKDVLNQFKSKYAWGRDSGFNERLGTKYLFDQDWYNRMHPSNLDLIKQTGGSVNRHILRKLDKDLKDPYRSKRYSKSLLATNQLFAPNYLFNKPSPRRIYNPNARYFRDGGTSNVTLPPEYLKSQGFVDAVNEDLYSILGGFNTDGYDSHYYTGKVLDQGVTDEQLRKFSTENHPTKKFLNAAAYAKAMNELAVNAGGKRAINIPFADNPIVLRTSADDIPVKPDYFKPQTIQEQGYIDSTGTNAVNKNQSYSTGLAKRYGRNMFDHLLKERNGGHVIKQRKGVRENPDGTVSSHLMRAEKTGKGWVAFPSLFQDDDGTWVDMSEEENWEKILDEAKKRGEVYEFGDDKFGALAFGMGSWKPENQEYNLKRALELGYEPDETGHFPSVDNQTGMWLKSKNHPTAWKEYMYGQLNKDIGTNNRVVVNPEGYFGDNQLQYIQTEADEKEIQKYVDGGYIVEDVELPKANKGLCVTKSGTGNSPIKRISDTWNSFRNVNTNLANLSNTSYLNNAFPNEMGLIKDLQNSNIISKTLNTNQLITNPNLLNLVTKRGIKNALTFARSTTPSVEGGLSSSGTFTPLADLDYTAYADHGILDDIAGQAMYSASRVPGMRYGRRDGLSFLPYSTEFVGNTEQGTPTSLDALYTFPNISGVPQGIQKGLFGDTYGDHATILRYPFDYSGSAFDMFGRFNTLQNDLFSKGRLLKKTRGAEGAEAGDVGVLNLTQPSTNDNVFYQSIFSNAPEVPFIGNPGQKVLEPVATYTKPIVTEIKAERNNINKLFQEGKYEEVINILNEKVKTGDFGSVESNIKSYEINPEFPTFDISKYNVPESGIPKTFTLNIFDPKTGLIPTKFSKDGWTGPKSKTNVNGELFDDKFNSLKEIANAARQAYNSFIEHAVLMDAFRNPTNVKKTPYSPLKFKFGEGGELLQANKGCVVPKRFNKIFNIPSITGIKYDWSGGINKIYNPYLKKWYEPTADLKHLSDMGGMYNKSIKGWEDVAAQDALNLEGKVLQIKDPDKYETKATEKFEQYMKKYNEFNAEVDKHPEGSEEHAQALKKFWEWYHSENPPLTTEMMHNTPYKLLSDVADQSKNLVQSSYDEFNLPLDLYNLQKTIDQQKIDAYRSTPLSYKLFGLSPGWKFKGIHHDWDTDVLFPYHRSNKLGKDIHAKYWENEYDKIDALRKFHEYSNTGSKTLLFKEQKENYMKDQKVLHDFMKGVVGKGTDGDDLINQKKGGELLKANKGCIIKGPKSKEPKLNLWNTGNVIGKNLIRTQNLWNTEEGQKRLNEMISNTSSMQDVTPSQMLTDISNLENFNYSAQKLIDNEKGYDTLDESLKEMLRVKESDPKSTIYDINNIHAQINRNKFNLYKDNKKLDLLKDGVFYNVAKYVRPRYDWQTPKDKPWAHGIGIAPIVTENEAAIISSHEINHFPGGSYGKSSPGPTTWHTYLDDELGGIKLKSDNELRNFDIKKAGYADTKFTNLMLEDNPKVKDKFGNDTDVEDHPWVEGKRYFNSLKEERSSYLAEVRESMLIDGFITDPFEIITPKKFEEYYNYYKNNTDKFPLRYLEIIEPTKENFKLSSDIFNKLLMGLPAAAGIGSELDDKRRGGSIGLKKFTKSNQRRNQRRNKRIERRNRRNNENYEEGNDWSGVTSEIIQPGEEMFDITSNPSPQALIEGFPECPPFHVYNTTLKKCVPMTEQEKADYGLKYMQDYTNSPQHKIMLRNSIKKDLPNATEEEIEFYTNDITALRRKLIQNPKVNFESTGENTPLGSTSTFNEDELITSDGKKLNLDWDEAEKRGLITRNDDGTFAEGSLLNPDIVTETDVINNPGFTSPLYIQSGLNNFDALNDPSYNKADGTFSKDATFYTLNKDGEHSYVYPHEFSHQSKAGNFLIPRSDKKLIEKYSPKDTFYNIWDAGQEERDNIRDQVFNSDEFKKEFERVNNRYLAQGRSYGHDWEPLEIDKSMVYDYIAGVNRFDDMKRTPALEELLKKYKGTHVNANKAEYTSDGSLSNMYNIHKDLYENNFDKFLSSTKIGQNVKDGKLDNNIPYDEFLDKHVKPEAFYKGFQNSLMSRHSYLSMDAEVGAKLDAIRMYGKAAGIYDPMTEPLTKEKFIELKDFWMKQNPKSQDANQFRQMLEIMDEEELFELLNTMSKNEETSDVLDVQYAKYGGTIELGDEVDEATMEELKKLGYTFEEI